MTNSTSSQGMILTLKNTQAYRLKFARGFLRSLAKIKRSSCNRTDHYNMNVSSSSFCSSDVDKIRKRSQRIKLAAYSSMARAVGPRKVWTRALLFKLHNRKKPSFFVRKRPGFTLQTKKKKKRASDSTYNPGMVRTRENNSKIITEDVREKTEKLREVVPGGKDMDICSLFEETAHFIQCLTLQVKVMQDVADSLSKP